MSCSCDFKLKKGGCNKEPIAQCLTAYQSPIALDCSDTIKVEQKLRIEGKNRCAVFNSEEKIFEVQDKIILTVNHKEYQLVEYHFHIQSEHKVNGKFYESEIHYVFIELNDQKKYNTHKCINICGSDFKNELNDNILVIGRVIKHTCEHTNLSKIDVRVPSSHYEYDGTLTTGDFSPVRWLVGDYSIKLNVKDIKCVAKTARPLQKLDGRIILLSKKK